MHPDFGGIADPALNEIYGFPYVVVGADQPKKAVQFYYGSESDGVNHANGQSFPFYPIPDEAITQPYWIEGGPPGNQAPGGDRHMLIVDRDSRYLYELFDLGWNVNAGRWEAGSGAFFDLNTNARRPEGWTSADAAGLAILPGLVRYEEANLAGEIGHAFRVTVRGVNGYVFPASHQANTNASGPPLGARLRLKASKDLSPYPAPVQRIFRAMQRHGLIVTDTGSDMYVGGTFDQRWNNDVLNPAFSSIKAGDFEVIQYGWNGGGGPCAPPDAPTNLAIAASGLNAQLSWLPPASGGVTQYVLEAGSYAGGVNLANTPVGNVTSLGATAPAGTYYVRVRGQNACGSGGASNEVVVTLPGGCAPPGVPGTLTYSKAGSIVTLAWGIPSGGATSGQLSVGGSPGASNILVTEVSGLGLTTVAPPGTYYVRLRARNACGLGPATNEIVVTVP
jgi:hypothetical protein